MQVLQPQVGPILPGNLRRNSTGGRRMSGMAQTARSAVSGLNFETLAMAASKALTKWDVQAVEIWIPFVKHIQRSRAGDLALKSGSKVKACVAWSHSPKWLELKSLGNPIADSVSEDLLMLSLLSFSVRVGPAVERNCWQNFDLLLMLIFLSLEWNDWDGKSRRQPMFSWIFLQVLILWRSYYIISTSYTRFSWVMLKLAQLHYWLYPHKLGDHPIQIHASQVGLRTMGWSS